MAAAKAWFQQQKGVIQELKLGDIPLPDEVEPGRVRVEVKSIGLNFADIFAMLGLYSATPKIPFVPGLEYAGVVTKIPKGGAKTYKVGDRVAGVTRFGAYTTALDAEEDYLERIPPEWSFEEGAAFAVQALTAYYGLVELGALKADQGQVVLVHSAAGGVGLLALDICHKLGAHCVCTVGTNDKKAFLLGRCPFLQEGQIIVRTNGSAFPAQLKAAIAATPGAAGRDGYDIVFDSLGGDYFQPGYDALARGGRLVLFGAGALMPHGNLGVGSLSAVYNVVKLVRQWMSRTKVDPFQMITDNKSIMGFNLIWMYDRKELMASMGERLLALGLRAPHVGHTYKFSEIHKAIEFFQTGANLGKVVVNNDL